MTLLGRQAESDALDRLLTDALDGRSRVVVLRGEAGVGKTALLEHVSTRAEGWHVAGASGVESEMELAFSGLHQLCGPMLEHIDRLPVPQRNALATVFGSREGAAPDRFLVGLAALTLFSEVADQRPLLCIIDDAQWLDQASAQILGFVARRLLAERIAIVCAARAGIGDGVLEGLPEISIKGLAERDARALLLASMQGPLDAALCERIVTESHGNPLALLELPRTWDATELAVGLPTGQPVAGKIERSYERRLSELPPQTQMLVVAAAAEPLGDPVLLQRAAGTLGIEMTAAEPATRAGLLTLSGRVTFAHPLARSAAYRSASADDRRRAHRALADATDVETDPDRRAWHLAAAAVGPEERVAAELERSAARAQSRGGLAAAAAFLQRAVALTDDPGRRTERALAAARANLGAGAFDAAHGLLTTAEAGPLDELEGAHVDLLRAELAFAESRGNDAPHLLLQAARKLESLDARLARETYLEAWGAALFAGRLAGAGGSMLDVSRAAATAPGRADPPRPSDLLLDGLALLLTDGHAIAEPVLRRALSAYKSSEVHDDEMLRWGWLATRAANLVWDQDSALEIGTRAVQLARDLGALEALAVVDNAYGQACVFAGDFATASLLAAEVDAVKQATGTRIAPHARLALAGLRGQEDEAAALIDTIVRDASAAGQGAALQYARWANAVLMNGLGRYELALASAVEASEDAPETHIAMWAQSEVVEAATRTGNADLAQRGIDRLRAQTDASEADWGLGISARSQALVSDGAAAERSYLDAIERLGRTRLRPELARSHLLYGEWLRRQGRRVDAREHLRTAHGMLATIGMTAFAERARHELLATGEKVRTRGDETREQLTPQEEQIARLARDGLSNPEIGAQLFISARTVEWHLSKVFTKLDIASRKQLRVALPEPGRVSPPLVPLR
jgi:DNA-binding CsgD family transcriptional regulator/tetratricopeptide (TPR) repeat protein